MSYAIELFMWGYQQHLQISLQLSAERLFDKIDYNLNPKVFLLGILTKEEQDKHPICLEPEDCGFSVKAFSDIDSVAEQFQKIDGENKIFHSHPIAQESHRQKISTNAQIKAIEKILERESYLNDKQHFISYPSYVNGYQVFVVLEIDKEALAKHYSLTKDKFRERYPISRSFIESTIKVFLSECNFALKTPDRTFKAIRRNSDEILREAGDLFMDTVSQVGEEFDGYGLFETCNMISSLKYEGAEGLGKMIIAKKDHSNIRLKLELQQPIRLNNYRKVRKFLEISNDNSIIISDSVYLYGLGEKVGHYNPKEESLFIIDFMSHFKWQVSHDNTPLMMVEYRQPNIPKERMNRSKFYSDLSRVFNTIQRNQLDILWDITTEATQQKHGTMLVVSANAKEEAKRLGNQSFPLQPIILNKDMVQQLTSIDGAVLLDENGYCHAIGVILDGLATEKGDSARGARYNSAIRYYEKFGKEIPTVLVIISEDGMINLIPNLKPQIKHIDIENAINEFSKMSEEKTFNNKNFNKLMDFFQKHEFYLTEEECSTINSLRKIIEEKDDSNIKILHNDLHPNNEMNASYYL